jgi:hypothetical protein
MYRTFDRYQEFDERSRSFRAVAGIEELPLRNRSWRCDVWNDQGFEGACVGFGWGHELSARPAPYLVDADFSRSIYYRARQLDRWIGEDYEGTSVLGGAKAVSELKTPTGQNLMDTYTWAFGTQEICRAIGYKGPVVFGCDWYEGMYDTDARGFVHVTGDIIGGHCVLINKVKLTRKEYPGPWVWSNINWKYSYVQGRNSWGRYWGMDGNFKISLTDFDRLVYDGADACVPAGRHYV